MSDEEPDTGQLSRSMYLTARNMSNELKEPGYTDNFRLDDWKEYAEGLAAAFRALDILLTNGGPFPHEWVVGNITIP